MITKFNIRVYFFLRDELSDKVLLSDELIQGDSYTKFPGGGLEFGEGPIDAAKREALEELGQDIEIHEHIHTTPFFQESRFLQGHQVICIYYSASLKDAQRFHTAKEKFDFKSNPQSEESFRWVSVNSALLNELSFPTDRAAFEAYLEKMENGS